MINLLSCQEQRDLQQALHSARKTKSKQPFILYTISHGLQVFGRRADRQLYQNQKGPHCRHSLLEMTWELWELDAFETSMKQFDFFFAPFNMGSAGAGDGCQSEAKQKSLSQASPMPLLLARAFSYRSVNSPRSCQTYIATGWVILLL